MRLTASYLPVRRDSPHKGYYRTLSADTLQEANKIALRWQKKGYRLATLIEERFSI